MAKLPNWDPAKHPHGEHGRWAHVASGDRAAKKLAVATKPKKVDLNASDWNFTGSKETQYHHRHIKAGQLEAGRDLESSQDELYALMRKGMTFEQAKAHLAKPDTVRASTTGPTKYKKGDVVQLGSGSQMWRIVRIDGDKATIAGDQSRASTAGGQTQTRIVPLSKLSGHWKQPKPYVQPPPPAVKWVPGMPLP